MFKRYLVIIKNELRFVTIDESNKLSYTKYCKCLLSTSSFSHSSFLINSSNS